MNRSKILFLGTLMLAATAATISAPADASACSYGMPMHFELTDEAPPEDQAPPAPPVIAFEGIERGHGPEQIGSDQQGASSCDDIGSVLVGIDSPDPALGYEFEITDGTVPEGLNFGGPYRLDDDPVRFTWADGAEEEQEPLDFTITAVAVDEWGQRSEPSEPLQISHPGREASGCSTAAPANPASDLVPLALFAAGLFFTRRFRAAP